MASSEVPVWSKPSDALVDQALSRVADIQHRRVFFDRLENPEWVRPLDVRRVFDSGPQTVTDLDGDWQYWPEGEYLIRMAPAAPQLVTEILSRAREQRLAGSVILRAAVALPSNQAIALLPAVIEWLHEQPLFRADEVVMLIAKFAEAGMRKPALRLANAAYRPRAHSSDEEGESRGRIVTGLEPYAFEHSIRGVFEALRPIEGRHVLNTACIWLEEWLRAGRRGDSEYSFLWRPSIADHSQNNRYRDFADPLVEAIRDEAVAQLATEEASAVVESLERSQTQLLSRIALYALAQAIRGRSDDKLDALGWERVLSPYALDPAFRPEYIELLTALLPSASTEEVLQWSAFALEPPLDAGEMRTRAERYAGADESIEDAVTRFRDQWAHRLLAALDSSLLPTELATRLSELNEKYGEQEHPAFSTWSWTSVGPQRPQFADEFDVMTAEQIVAALARWDPADEPGDATKEGLSRALEAAVAKRPVEFSTIIPLIAEIDPTYARTTFAGLEKALPTNPHLDWPRVISAVALVTSQNDEGSDPDPRMDEDVVWRWAQAAAASLLTAASGETESKGLDLPELAAALAAIEPLLRHEDPTVEDEARYGGSNMDPLTLSLNTTRPAAVRAVLGLAARAAALGADATDPGADALTERGLGLIRGLLVPVRDHSLAVAATLGASLGVIMRLDESGALTATPELLEGEFGDVVMSTALATHHPSVRLLGLLQDAIVERLSTSDSIRRLVAGWQTSREPLELIGDHIVGLRVRGFGSEHENLYDLFFEVAPATVRASVLGHLGWLFMNADSVDADVLERARALIDERVALIAAGEVEVQELAGFAWWVDSGKFEPAWWLPILEVAAGCSEFELNGGVGEQLESAAIEQPRESVEVLERILKSKSNSPFGRFELVRHAPSIIAVAIKSGDPEAGVVARRTIDLLGRGGDLRIAEVVDRLLAEKK